MVMQELKRYSVNPELEFQVIDCITNILKLGKQGNRKESDIWTIINMFTAAMTKTQDEGLTFTMYHYVVNASEKC
jgi:hypothetical protein